MNDKYILNAAGEPELCEDLLTWARWYETAERHLAQDVDEGNDSSVHVRVSTVFLGLDHNFFGGPPILWETMVFGGLLDGEQERYTSRAAALAGHQRWCQRVNAALRP